MSFRRINYKFYSAIATFQNLGQRIMFSFVQLYAEAKGASAAELGWMLSFNNILSFSGQQVFGKLSDRLGRITVLLIGFMLSAITSVVIIKSVIPITIIIVFAMYALGFSAIEPSFNALIGDTYTQERRTEMLGMILSTSGLIGSMSFLVVGLLADTMEDPYFYLFIISAISFAAAFLAVIALHLLKRVPYQERSVKTPGINLFEPLKIPFFRKFVFIDGLFVFTMAMAWPLFPVPTNRLATTGQVTIMWATTFTLFSITARFSSRLKNRLGSYTKTIYLSRSVIWIVPFTFAFATHWTHLLLARIVAGLTFGVYVTMQKDYILESVRVTDQIDNRGWFLGTHAFVYGIATFLGSLISGNIAEFVLSRGIAGYSELFLGVAAFRFVFSFLFLKVPDIK